MREGERCKIRYEEEGGNARERQTETENETKRDVKSDMRKREV